LIKTSAPAVKTNAPIVTPQMVKKGVKGIGEIVTAATAVAVITAATPIIITVVAKTKGVDMKNLVDPKSPDYDPILAASLDITQSGLLQELTNSGGVSDATPTAQQQGFKTDSEMKVAQTALLENTPPAPTTGSTTIDNPTPPNDTQQPKQDNTLLYVIGGGVALFALGKATNMF
jgi:hypothetical protein